MIFGVCIAPNIAVAKIIRHHTSKRMHLIMVIHLMNPAVIVMLTTIAVKLHGTCFFSVTNARQVPRWVFRFLADNTTAPFASFLQNILR